MATLTVYGTNTITNFTTDTSSATDAAKAEKVSNSPSSVSTSDGFSQNANMTVGWTLRVIPKTPNTANAYEYYITFDTSALGSGASVTAASFNIFSGSGISIATSQPINVYSTSAYDTHTWHAGNTLNSLTKVASMSSPNPGSIPFTESGTNLRTSFNTTGNSYYFVAANTMATDTVPSLNGGDIVPLRGSFAQESSPVIVITYSAAAPATGATGALMGVG